ncbi:hypothetical protein KAI04_04920 [Candidatus Pacearchaeota archaeon]|nr:hypothetical protein [Candidatus Pacearchaeota archaeon]
MKSKILKLIKEVPELKSNRWYEIPLHIIHECCVCGNEHEVKFKIKNNTLYTKWKGINTKNEIKNSKTNKKD